MDFIRRIGTQRHKFKLQFIIRKITFNKALLGKVYVSIRRGTHKKTTQNNIQMVQNVCDFNKEIVTFEQITLFYDESEKKYQEKLGQMKIILQTSNSEKKKLGVVSFDVAQFVNAKKETGFIANQTEQKLTFKRDLEQTPSKLQAQISFNVYIKFVGEGSQTEKSMEKSQKNRGQSPFDKIGNFFSGLVGDDQQKKKKDEKSKQKDSKRVSIQQRIKTPNKQQTRRTSKNEEILSKKIRDRQNSVKTKEKYISEDQSSKISKRKKQPDQTAGENIKEQPKHHKKREKRISPEEIQDKQQQIPTIKQSKKQRNKESTLPKSISKQQKENASRINDQSKQSRNKKNKVQYQEQQGSNSQIIDQVPKVAIKVKPSKNLITQNHRDTLTQYDEDYSKNSVKHLSVAPAKHNQPINQFYFDDPNTFPEHFKSSSRQKFNVKANLLSKDSKNEINFTEPRIAKNNTESISSKHETAEIKHFGKKTKQNTIIINPKDVQRKEQTAKRPSKAQSINARSNPPQNSSQLRQGKTNSIVKQPKQIKPVVIKQKTAQDLNKEEIENLFTSFDNEQKLQQDKINQNQKQLKNDFSDFKIPKVQLSMFQKQQVELKNRELIQLKQKMEKLLSKSKQDQKSRVQNQNQAKLLKQENERLKKQLENKSAGNNDLKMSSKSNNNISNSHIDIEVEEQIKRLQRQKNQHLINLQREKQKNKKESKLLNESIERQKLKYKQLEDLSKVELKKLKDENNKINTNLENSKQKLKEKTKENTTLIKENKTLNQTVIELKEKLQTLKIKICEKLNEANENGEAELMEALTYLNQSI